ncbi:hypothetical protein AB0870_06090 [Microbacterium proteolyticum]|jgi:hypothetical protein|uniref:hypothetical protein n=1 Tax=Microbacterium TaxID=33882 RepID=UPI002415F073|nr:MULTISPECIES: hypothetical protein [Microbacterium]MBQ9918305.1 hypothetical protein [Microbacterium sp.]
MTTETRFPLAAATVMLAVLCAPLAACSSAATPEAIAPVATESTEDASTSAAAPDAAAPDAGAPIASDLCAVVSDDEVAGVVGIATVDTGLTFGSLDEATGGQCVWASTATPGTYLELAAWPAGSINPAPAEAPAPGSGGFVTTPGGAYFADATHSFRLAVTGSADPAREAAAQTLAQAVQARR